MPWRLWLCTDDAVGKNYREHLTKEKVTRSLTNAGKMQQQIINMKKILFCYY